MSEGWSIDRIEALLPEIEAYENRVPDGPWFVAADKAKECGPHANSGLALVDTGRSSDWPIARLCEWHTAEFIAQSRANISSLKDAIRFLLAENKKLARQVEEASLMIMALGD